MPASPGQDDLTAAVRAAQQGDEEAFRTLYRSVQPGLLRFLGVLVGGDAEDVASEAWLQIARDLPAFRGDGGAFRGWAATIGRNRATDHLRSQRRRPVQPTPIEVLADLVADHDTAGEALRSVSTEAAIALIAALPRDQAEAVLLRVVVGLDVKTAAGVLGKRSGAVRTAAYRGLHRLADLFEREGPPGGGATDPATGTLGATE
ncbi:MAG: RNA polymerase sigma factor [Dactylosporangium sp.]|nr:RNA polymerase sigma factor [Dactylosporangium sp.]